VPRKVDPEEPVEAPELRPFGALGQEGELLSKGEVLQRQIGARAQGRAERAQQSDCELPHERADSLPSQASVKAEDPILTKHRWCSGPWRRATWAKSGSETTRPPLRAAEYAISGVAGAGIMETWRMKG